MNQQLEHGMKVRANKITYSMDSGKVLWATGETHRVKISPSNEVIIGRWVAFREDGWDDYTARFNIIPDPVTAEEAMEKILEWRKKLTLIDAGLYDIINEYKKGLGND